MKNSRFNSLSESEEPQYCLENTRAQILHNIDDWVNDPEGPYIFWMSGLAGTGKSTIARTMARKYDDQNRLGASYFFCDLHHDNTKGISFVTTIARQLAEVDASLRDDINKSISQRPDIASHSLEDQWRLLILGPLARVKLGPGQLPYLLVVDAVEKCHTTAIFATIMHLLAQTRALVPRALRIFVTSRPDARIEAVFDEIPKNKRRCLKLHSINDKVVDHDINTFLAYRFKRIAKSQFQEQDWPGFDAINMLTQQAGGLFIWAAAACKFVEWDSRFSRQRLVQLLNGSVSIDDPGSQLDKIYLTVLRSTVSDRHTAEEKAVIYNILRLVLGTMAVLVSPLSITDLGALLQSVSKSSHAKFPGVEDLSTLDIYLNLKCLGAIVDVPEDHRQVTRLHHPTFREFLFNEARCTDQAFHVDRKEAHLTLAKCCVSIMSQSWECYSRGRGIFGLANSGTTVTDARWSQLEQKLSPSLRYACLYWVHHLQQSGVRIQKNDTFDCFLRAYILNWLESLTWMKKFSDAVRAIASLECMTFVSGPSISYAQMS